MNPFLAAVFALPLAPAADLDPALPYQAKRSNAVSYTVDYRVTVTAPQNTKKLRVWMPVPQSDAGQRVEGNAFHVFPTEATPTFHTEKVFGNMFAYFEFDNPQGAQIISQSFRATVWQLNWS